MGKELTAAQIIESLHTLFSNHVCFSEVKNGPTWNRTDMRKADFVAIKPTWHPPCIIICEIKTAKSDFLNDRKWPEYLPMCNMFYWACPKNMIAKDEIDAKAGLIYVDDNGRARTRKAAIYRNETPHWGMLLYLLLWRDSHALETPEARRQRILREMEDNQRVGKEYARFVSRKLAKAQAEIEDLRKQCTGSDQALVELRQLVKEKQLGEYDIRWICEHLEEIQEVKDHADRVNSDVTLMVEHLKHATDQAIKAVEQAKKILGKPTNASIIDKTP